MGDCDFDDVFLRAMNEEQIRHNKVMEKKADVLNEHLRNIVKSIERK